MLKISVVTPSYNQARFIEECLLGVKQQNYPDIEHVVVDAASNDGTVEILQHYSRMPGWEHLRWISEPDRGQSDALNKGFRMATGDAIGWLNADDFYMPGCFQAVARFHAKHPSVDVLYGDYLWIDEKGTVCQVRREIDFRRFVLLYNRVNFIHSSGALFLQKRIINDGHFIDERFHYAMDYEYYLRLMSLGYRFQHLSTILSSFRWHKESKTTKGSSHIDDEIARVRAMYTSSLNRFQSPFARKLILGMLISVASLWRWGEKGIKGYYFTQFVSKKWRVPL